MATSHLHTGLQSVGGSLASAVVSGGTHTSDASYDYYAFTTSDTLTVSTGGLVDVLVVGGGGGGGGYYSGGGGAGGEVIVALDYLISAGSISVTVGAGGTAGGGTSGTGDDGVNGGHSLFDNLLAVGGGAGGGATSGSDSNFPGHPGGHGGGGGGRNSNAGAASLYRGFAGGNALPLDVGGTGAGGGGGGAGEAGSDGSGSNIGGDGGDGLAPSGFGS